MSLKKSFYFLSLCLLCAFSVLIVGMTSGTAQETPEDYQRMIEQAKEQRKLHSREGMGPALPTPFSPAIPAKDLPKAKPAPEPPEYKPNFEPQRPLVQDYREQLRSLVRAWAVGSLTMGYYDFTERMKNNKAWFTDTGWADYQTYLQDNKVSEWLNQKDVLGTVSVTGIHRPTIVAEQKTEKGYKWTFRTNMLRNRYSNRTHKGEYDYISVYFDVVWRSEGMHRSYKISKFKLDTLNNIKGASPQEIELSIPDNGGSFHEIAAQTLKALLDEEKSIARKNMVNSHVVLGYVRSFYMETMLSAYTLSNKDVDQQLQERQKDYTKSGWDGYMEQIAQADILSDVRNGAQLVARPYLSKGKPKRNGVLLTGKLNLTRGAPKLLKSGKMGGHDTWYFKTTFKVDMDRGEEKKPRAMLMRPQTYVTQLVDENGFPYLQISTFHNRKFLPFDKYVSPYDKMSAEEMQQHLKDRCEQGSTCTTSYQEALILGKKTREKRRYAPLYGRDEEILSQYCEGQGETCKQKFGGELVKLRGLKQFEEIRDLGMKYPKAYISCNSSTPFDKKTHADVLSLEAHKELQSHYTFAKKVRIEPNGWYSKYCGYLVSLVSAWVSESLYFPVGDFNHASAMKKKWFTPKAWEQFQNAIDKVGIKEKLRNGLFGLETVVTFRERDHLPVKVIGEKGNVEGADPTWFFRLNLSHLMRVGGGDVMAQSVVTAGLSWVVNSSGQGRFYLTYFDWDKMSILSSGR